VLDELKASKLLPLLKDQSSGDAQHAVSISLTRSRSAAEAKPSALLQWSPSATRLRRLRRRSDGRSKPWAAEQAPPWGGSGRPTLRGNEHSHVRAVGEQAVEKAVLSAWGWSCL
jgi:hypothetical protein